MFGLAATPPNWMEQPSSGSLPEQPLNLPSNFFAPAKSGGMFGNGKFGIGQAIVAALNGYLAGTGNPVGTQNLQMMAAMRQRQMERQQELDDYNRRRADQNSDWQSHYQYEIDHPKPVNNDTVADYSFWKQTLPPEQFQQWLENKINPPQYMNVPGVGLVQVPRQAAPAAPTAPVGKLTPINGGPTPGASGGFPY
jgi:hypothetical protein